MANLTHICDTDSVQCWFLKIQLHIMIFFNLEEPDDVNFDAVRNNKFSVGLQLHSKYIFFFDLAETQE